MRNPVAPLLPRHARGPNLRMFLHMIIRADEAVLDFHRVSFRGDQLVAPTSVLRTLGCWGSHPRSLLFSVCITLALWERARVRARYNRYNLAALRKRTFSRSGAK